MFSGLPVKRPVAPIVGTKALVPGLGNAVLAGVWAGLLGWGWDPMTWDSGKHDWEEQFHWSGEEGVGVSNLGSKC